LAQEASFEPGVWSGGLFLDSRELRISTITLSKAPMSTKPITIIRSTGIVGNPPVISSAHWEGTFRKAIRKNKGHGAKCTYAPCGGKEEYLS